MIALIALAAVLEGSSLDASSFTTENMFFRLVGLKGFFRLTNFSILDFQQTYAKFFLPINLSRVLAASPATISFSSALFQQGAYHRGP
jgi:hypothetical protein